MTEIVLVRHATSAHQAPESPLTPAGVDQAEALVELLSSLDIARIVSSPYHRALQTVEPFRASSGLAVEVDVSFPRFNGHFGFAVHAAV